MKPFVTVGKITIIYNSYSEVKKDLAMLLAHTNEKQIIISRFKRGESREWIEIWAFNDNYKPILIKEFWK